MWGRCEILMKSTNTITIWEVILEQFHGVWLFYVYGNTHCITRWLTAYHEKKGYQKKRISLKMYNSYAIEN